MGPVVPCVVFSHVVDNEQLTHDPDNIFATKILNASSPEFIRTVRTALHAIISDPERQPLPISESQISTATAPELWIFCVNNFGPWGSRSERPVNQTSESELFDYNCILRREQFFHMLIPAIKTEFPLLKNIHLKKTNTDNPDTPSIYFALELSIPHPEWPNVHIHLFDNSITISIGDTKYPHPKIKNTHPDIYPDIDPDRDSLTKSVNLVIAQLKHISQGGTMTKDKFLDTNTPQRTSNLIPSHFARTSHSLPPW
ncbi:MAG: hypothetical protein B5766_08940 [Candidatus Lumbricidophila eiseniae]|uniref:Uncharacterized protein n=1 Tax=Candidatus Lumbricidiphila eiseniae TaxID=1969409 RepID=A0A2A6FQC2_9MICO|nr:MAG: hypothetical protein B5766_08940 [Candidatus Lumbricidophila eiseniae]